MNRKTAFVFLLLALAVLVGIPESFARPQYFTNLTAVYGDGSCGTCHIRASGGGPRNDYGTLFENQPNHFADPRAALITIGQPPTAATLTPVETLTPVIPETPASTSIPAVTTSTATQPSPGFGFAALFVGLFVCFLLARQHNK